MGCQESKEEVDRRELDEVVNYFRGSPNPMQGNPFGEISYRHFIKKDSKHKRNIWAFNRTAFFSLKDGFIIGLYALFGLIAQQKDDEKRLKKLKKILEKGVCNINELRNIPEFRYASDTEKKLIVNAYKFIKDALPESDFTDCFVPQGWMAALGLLFGGIGTGVGAAIGTTVSYELIKTVSVGTVLAGTGIGIGVGLLLGLAISGAIYLYQRHQKEKAKKKSVYDLFFKLAEYFNDKFSERALPKKLQDLEKKNLFIIKIGFTSDEPVEFLRLDEPRLYERFDYLPDSNSTDREDKLKRDYYKALFKLYGKAMAHFTRNNLEGNMPMIDLSMINTFVEEYRGIVDNWKRYCIDQNLEQYGTIEFDYI